MRCAAARIRPIRISARRWPGSRELRPKRAILTHMDNSMDYATLVAELPDGVEPGYDGMEIDAVSDGDQR